MLLVDDLRTAGREAQAEQILAIARARGPGAVTLVDHRRRTAAVVGMAV